MVGCGKPIADGSLDVPSGSVIGPGHFNILHFVSVLKEDRGHASWVS